MLQIGNSNYFASQQFDANANMLPVQVFQYQPDTPFAASVDSTYKSFELSLYAEIGVFKRFDILLYIPFYRIIQQTYPDNPDFQVSGPSDGYIGAKVNFLDEKYIVLAMRGDIDLPIGDAGAGQHYPDPFGSKFLPMPLGDKEVAGDLVLTASSAPAPKVPIYLSADFGAKFHSSHTYGNILETYSHELLFAFEFGYSLVFKKYVWCWLPKIDFILNFRGVASLHNGKLIDVTKGGAPAPQGYSYNLYLPNDQTYLQIGPQVNFNLWKYFFANIRYERVIWGKNTGVGDIVGVGIGAYR